jgi:phospholipase D1/2
LRPPTRIPTRLRRFLLALLVLVVLAVVIQKMPVTDLVVRGAKALHGKGPGGAAITCAGIYLLTLLFFPIIPLIVACGWLYGTWGALLSLAAAVASAATSFSLARALGRKAAAQALLERPRARALADLAAKGGVLTVALVRLSPMLPYTPSNAILGLTSMRLRDMTLGTALGMAPGIVLYSWAGSLLPSAEAIEKGASLRSDFVWVLLGAAILAATILGIAAARRLKLLADAKTPSGHREPRS